MDRWYNGDLTSDEPRDEVGREGGGVRLQEVAVV